MTPTGTRPIAVTIAGSDSSGGAGIQADIKTFAALGVYGASVITCLTAQNTRGVSGVHAVPSHFISAQIDAIASDLDVVAIKTGMLFDVATARAVAKGLDAFATTAVVVDPVMVATSGDVLLSPDAIDVVRAQILPRAVVITPNRAEAATLLDTKIATTRDEMRAQARQLLQFGCRAVLITGGDLTAGENSSEQNLAIDCLVTADSDEIFSAPRIETGNTHGTGCTLSAAITAALAQGLPLAVSVRGAKDFVTGALKAARSLKIGHGAGPLDHAWATHHTAATP